MTATVITSIPDLAFFKDLMENNPGLILIKLGAIWCGPCQAIEEDVKTMFEFMPNNVQCVSIDIDNNIDFYSFLKKKRVVNGVPVILCYQQGNLSNMPDDYMVGGNRATLQEFAQRVLKLAQQVDAATAAPST